MCAHMNAFRNIMDILRIHCVCKLLYDVETQYSVYNATQSYRRCCPFGTNHNCLVKSLNHTVTVSIYLHLPTL